MRVSFVGIGQVFSLSLIIFVLFKTMKINLPSLRITGSTITANESVTYATCTSEPGACPYCLGSSIYHHGTKQLIYCDIPVNSKRSLLSVETNRYRCRSTSCRKTFNQKSADISETYRATSRLIEYIEDQSMFRANTDIANQIGITEGTVRSIIIAYLARLERLYCFETPVILGVGQYCLDKKVLTALTNNQEGTLVDIVRGSSEKDVLAALYRLIDRRAIDWVVIPLSSHCRKAVEAAIPGAKVTINRQAIADQTQQIIKAGRIAMKVVLPKKEWIDLLLCDNESALNAAMSGRPAKLLDLHPLLLARVELMAIFNQQSSRAQAMMDFARWDRSLSAEVRDCFSDLIALLDECHDAVFNFFDSPSMIDNADATARYLQLVLDNGCAYSTDILRARGLYINAKYKTGLNNSAIMNFGVDLFAE